MPKEQQDQLLRVKKFVEASTRFRRPYVDRWNTYYGLYRNYRKLAASNAAEPDRDVLESAKREWGAELFIPYCFATIETIVPRILSSNPRMKVKPLDEEARASAQMIAKLFEQRQNEIKYALQLQPIVRSGLKYGLGVGKTYWDRDARTFKRLEPRILGRGYKEVDSTETKSEGPNFEFVDVLDFFWDASARDMDTCEDAMHRTWRPTRYVADMIESGRWATPMALDIGKGTKPLLSAETVEGLGTTDRSTLLQDRMTAAGLGDQSIGGDKLHEVWEYHDRERVITILDKQFVVQNKPCYYHGELPFQVFRPTPQEGEFVGIGEIEPIAHLQYELNTLRSQRRDNATLVLQKAFLYTEGRLADSDDLTIAPGEGIPVYGSPRDVIMPLEFGEIPNSGYSEEEALKADIERTTGVSESTAGGDAGSADTATGIQLIQSAANVRIAQKSENLKAEIIDPAANQWLELYRQFTFGQRTLPMEDPTAQDGYSFGSIGPDGLASKVEVIGVSGSTEPENIPQKRNDAMVVANQLNGDPDIDQRKLKSWMLGEFDIAHPETWLTPEQPTLDPNVVGELLVQAGMDQNAALQLIQAALQTSSDVQSSQDGGHPNGPVQPDQGAQQ